MVLQKDVLKFGRRTHSLACRLSHECHPYSILVTVGTATATLQTLESARR